VKNLLYIGNRLSKHGLTPTTIEIFGPQLEQEGFVVKYSSSKKNKIFRLFDMLFTVFRNSKADFVLIDTYSTSNFWFAFLVSQLCRLLKLKYIPILHGGNLSFRLSKNPKTCKMIFNNSYKNVSPSLYLKKQFSDYGFQNVIHIPNAVAIEKYPFLQRKIINPHLLWVRSFAAIYNPNMAIEVFLKIKNKYPHATLCMVGPEKDGSLKSAQKRAQELNLEIVFTGKLSKKDWIELSKGYDVFINTTHFDNMPVSIVEAMALGMPIVSTNVGGIPFLLNDHNDALLVPDNDVNKMVDAVVEIIENPELTANFTMNSRKKAEHYDWQLIRLKWLSIFN
jgi:glycosyltransferase involved in cell wall biosynthesis